jgi:IMP dehydrogenase/GMP reductase
VTICGLDETKESELDLTRGSNKKVKKICDSCGTTSIVRFSDVNKSRKRRNTTKDYCLKCATMIYNSGNGNPSKLPANKLKISQNTRGKSKTFKDGNNPRLLTRKINTAGYILIHDGNDYILEHRKIMEGHLKRRLEDNEVIHHIDGNKKNNNVNNLTAMTRNEHSAMHKNIEKIIFNLLSLGIVGFDRKNKKYYITPKTENENMPISLGFENVAFTQNENKCDSRLHVDIKSEVIRGVNLEIPMIASNMSTVCDGDFCILLNKLGALGVMHRASDENILCDEIKKISKECEWVAGSIGIDEDQLILAEKLINSGANILFIDVAHGYNKRVIELGHEIKKKFPHAKIVLGNTINENMIYDCYKFADAIKVGIAQGFACETKNTAGCTEKQFSAVSKFKYLSKNFNIPVISDGGTREPADLVKAIGAGANSIMAGKIFAACPESAAEVLEINGSLKKVYAGMASRYVQNRWKGKLKDGTCPEGGVRYLDVGESAEKLLERYSGALRSGITYAGATNISYFQEIVKFIRIS